jgi:hypothetical protein
LMVPSYISSALYNFSDHLPVIMELEASVSGLGQNSFRSLQNSWSIVNPARNSIELNFKGVLSEEALEVIVLNLSGQIVSHKKSNASNALVIDCSRWSQGIYIISLKNGQGFQDSRKVIVQ